MVIKFFYRGCVLYVVEKNIFEVIDCWKFVGICIKFGLVFKYIFDVKGVYCFYIFLYSFKFYL